MILEQTGKKSRGFGGVLTLPRAGSDSKFAVNSRTTMSATRDMMKTVVAAFAPALKSAGYRKQGARFWNESSPSVVRLVNIQSSSWNSGCEGKFTVNLGVYHRDFAAFHDGMPVVTSPLVQNCVIQTRIGRLMPAPRDVWWSIDQKTDLVALGAKVASIWIEYGKPWLEARSTLDGARVHFLHDKDYLFVAMASLAMGNSDDAELWLDKAVESNPLCKDYVEAWRSAHLHQQAVRPRRTKP